MRPNQRHTAGLVGVVIILLACAEPTTAPAAPSGPDATLTPFDTELLSPQWQQRGRALVGANGIGPAGAGRVYAALSVAQYRAVLAADAQQDHQDDRHGHPLGAGGRNRYEMHRGAVSGASAEVLGFLFPASAAALELQVIADADPAVGRMHPGFERGLIIGRAVGRDMVEHLQNDGANLPWTGTVPVGPGYWIPSGPPAGANLGGVTPYVVNSTSQFRSPAPPAFGSPAFLADLAEVLTISQNRTAQQTAIAQAWASAGAPSTPLGYWNLTAAAYIEEAGLTERAAVRVFAVTHAAQFDAQLTCFESKYHYFVPRPNQVEPLISLVIGQPNYPAYPSGHACISSSAAHVLAHFFPDHAAELADLVEEAGVSRIYGGIHYRFDIDAGQLLGRAVADWAIEHEERLR